MKQYNQEDFENQHKDLAKRLKSISKLKYLLKGFKLKSPSVDSKKILDYVRKNNSAD